MGDGIKTLGLESGQNFDVSHQEYRQDHPLQGCTTKPYAEHGAPIDVSLTAEARSKRGTGMGLVWPRTRHYLREPFAEFMGTFILIMFGDGGVAQAVLSKGEKGNYQSISWSWVCWSQRIC